MITVVLPPEELPEEELPETDVRTIRKRDLFRSLGESCLQGRIVIIRQRGRHCCRYCQRYR